MNITVEKDGKEIVFQYSEKPVDRRQECFHNWSCTELGEGSDLFYFGNTEDKNNKSIMNDLKSKTEVAIKKQLGIVDEVKLEVAPEVLIPEDTKTEEEMVVWHKFEDNLATEDSKPADETSEEAIDEDVKKNESRD